MRSTCGNEPGTDGRGDRPLNNAGQVVGAAQELRECMNEALTPLAVLLGTRLDPLPEPPLVPQVKPTSRLIEPDARPAPRRAERRGPPAA